MQFDKKKMDPILRFWLFVLVVYMVDYLFLFTGVEQPFSNEFF